MALPQGLIPRAYQLEIFRKAQKENVIAPLDTGSGKTYIAALLIKWLATQYHPTRKIYVFIVPRVPLVAQQTDFLNEQLPLTVRGYYGAIVDPWQHDPVRWRKEFEECDVMVMTAQVLVDALTHAHWAVSQIALLAIDEAHHTRGRHPYNQIMSDFFAHCNPTERPKVFGMTASPAWNNKNPAKSLRTLEENLFSKIVWVKENTRELQEFSPRPSELLVEYGLDSSIPKSYPQSLWDRVMQLDLHSFPAFIADNIEQRYAVTLAEIGRYGADYYLHLYLRTLLSSYKRGNLYEFIQLEVQEQLIDIPSSVLHSDPKSMDSTDTDVSVRMHHLKDSLSQFSEFISFEEEILPEWLSPKLRRLVELLAERRAETPDTFQGIIFVEQRQVAATLAWILPRIPSLKGWVNSGALVGHSSHHLSKSQGMATRKQQDLLKGFKSGTYNLLISTSVGEEGLDFQACDLIVRYNELQNMVGYLQSRGRARKNNSTYVIMIAKHDEVARRKYENLQLSEYHIKDVYMKQGHLAVSKAVDDMEDIGDVGIRYRIPSTGAVLTFGSAISLLNHLCALIPRDKYTRAFQPEYELSPGFIATVTLPSALPIPRDKLGYAGLFRRTKREAKAAAAFNACKALHELGVFDDYLLPTRPTRGAIEDADGRSVPEINVVDEMMDVLVLDPWCSWSGSNDCTASYAQVWIYGVTLLNQASSMALVSPSEVGLVPPVVLKDKRQKIDFGIPRKQQLVRKDMQVLQDFTTIGIRWCNTPKRIKMPLTGWLAPLDANGDLDFDLMKEILACPLRPAIDNIAHMHEDTSVIQCKYAIGRPLLLRCLRDDLSPLSRPLISDGAESEGDFDTYLAFFEQEYGTKTHLAQIPQEGPLLLVEKFDRSFFSQYSLLQNADKQIALQSNRKRWLVPASVCEVLAFPKSIIETFSVYPQMIRRITDVYRARLAVQNLGLPTLIEDRVIEALTLPCSNAGYSNQRLETMGDAVLKLSVIVYIFNKFPYRHEGQLDNLRMNSVSNRTLLARAKEIRLETFITSEPSHMKKWPLTEGEGKFVEESWHVTRRFPRRSLQDCMESLLGASFLSGGINACLRTGTKLQLCFGGETPWSARYGIPETSPVPVFFDRIQERLGYRFKSGKLLVEAITHSSVASDVSCYQRLEFLGDALLDVVVLEYIFLKFPQATSAQLHLAKSRAIWAPSLTTIAVRQLSLHKYVLVYNPELQKAMGEAVKDHNKMSYEDTVIRGWLCDPPKILSDVVESLCGAMFIDSGYDYHKVKTAILHFMDPILQLLHPNLPKDPTSELLLTIAKTSCQRARFRKSMSGNVTNGQNDTICFVLHDKQIGDAIRVQAGVSLARAKPRLAEQVKGVLDEQTISKLVSELCDCASTKNEKERLVECTLGEVDREQLDDEKEDEFAVLALLALEDEGNEEVALSDADEQEVEEMPDILDRMEL